MQPLHDKYDPPIAKIKTIRESLNNKEGGLETSNGDIDSGGKWFQKTFRELLGSNPPTHEIIYGEGVSDMPCKKIKQINKEYISAYCAPSDLLNDISMQFSKKFHKIPVIEGIYDWSDRKDFAYGNVFSLYEKDSISNVQTGEPLADALAIVTRQNCSILALADGVSWGRKSKLSSNCAVHGATIYLCEHIDSCTTTKDVFCSILHAFEKAQQEIVEMEATLTTLCVGVVVQLQEKDRWAFCVVNVGDSYAYFYNKKIGVKEVTYGSHPLDEERDMRFSGGSLGPADGYNPDLGNLTCSFVIIEKDDIVFLCSDGISDNYDPAIAMFNPKFKILQNNEVNDNKTIVNNKSNPVNNTQVVYKDYSSTCLPFSTKSDGTKFIKEDLIQDHNKSSSQPYYPPKNIETQLKNSNTYVQNTRLLACNMFSSTKNVAESLSKPSSEFLDLDQQCLYNSGQQWSGNNSGQQWSGRALKSYQKINRKNQKMSKSLNSRNYANPRVLQEVNKEALLERNYRPRSMSDGYYISHKKNSITKILPQEKSSVDRFSMRENDSESSIQNNLDDKCAEIFSVFKLNFTNNHEPQIIENLKQTHNLAGDSSIRENKEFEIKNLNPSSQINKHFKKEDSFEILEKDEYIFEPTGTSVSQTVENKIQNSSEFINNDSPNIPPNTKSSEKKRPPNMLKNLKQPHYLAGDSSMRENDEIEMKNLNPSSQINKHFKKEGSVEILEKDEYIFEPTGTSVPHAVENKIQNSSEFINNDSPNIPPNTISLTPRDRHDGILERMTEVIVGSSPDEVPIDGVGVRAIDVCVRIMMFVLKRTEEKRQVLELVPPSKLNQLSPKEKKDKYASMKKDLEGVPGKLDHASIVAYQVGLHEKKNFTQKFVYSRRKDSLPTNFSPTKIRHSLRRSSENKISNFENVSRNYKQYIKKM